MSGTVACVGSLNLDRVLSVPRLPGPGETALALSALESCGGKGANQAAAAAGFGAAVAMIGCVGDDAAGTVMLEDLRARGVSVDGVRVLAAQRSGSAVVLVAADGGENTIVVDPAANARVEVADVEVIAVREAAVLLTQLEVPLEAVAAAAAACAGVVVLNCAPFRPLGAELLGHVDVLVANQTELGQLAGAPAPGSLEEAEALVSGAGAGLGLSPGGSLIVTAGAAGALVLDGASGSVLSLPAPSVDSVDSTGAGDCFCGVLAAALAGGAGLVQASRAAVHAASRSTLAAGARGGLPGPST